MVHSVKFQQKIIHLWEGLNLVSFKAIIEKDIDILAFSVGPKAAFRNEIGTKFVFLNLTQFIF